MSHVTGHMSCHMLNIFSYLPRCQASQCRACDQRGIPRLVAIQVSFQS